MKQERSRILLIDDDRSLLITLEDFLRFEGYDVVTAESAEVGLERLEDMHPDLIVLDMSMPGMGGMGFLERITEGGKPKYPVLVLTARAQMAEFFGNVQVDGFVAKPCDPSDLLMEISRIVFLTRGLVPEDSASGGMNRQKVLLGDEDEVRRGPLVEALTGNGYLVRVVTKGAEVLEKAILEHPDAIVLSAVLARGEACAVPGMLRDMPNTARIPIVIYGVVEEAPLDEACGRSLAGCSPEAVVNAVAEVLEAQSEGADPG